MSQAPFSGYRPWTRPTGMPVMRQVDPQDDTYFEEVDSSYVADAEVVTNRICAIAQLIEAITMTEGAEADVARLRKLAMELLIDPEPEPETPEESPHEIDNGDIE